MPLDVCFVDDNKRINCIGSGCVTGMDLIDATKKLYQDERSQNVVYQLIDLSDVEVFDVSSIEMKTIAKMDNEFARNCTEQSLKIAVIGTKDIVYAMSRVWGAFVSLEGDAMAKVFRNRDEAISWLESK